MPVSDINPSEFGRLFIQYKDGFVDIAMSYVRNMSVAQDIVSESFTSFWDRRKEIDLKTTPQSYILKSVKNRCLNHLRDTAKDIDTKGDVDPEVNLRLRAMLAEASLLESGEMADVLGNELERLFGKFLDGMPELSRKIFLSNRFEDLTYAEIAAKYGVTPRKVKRVIQKSLESLRLALKDYL